MIFGEAGGRMTLERIKELLIKAAWGGVVLLAAYLAVRFLLPWLLPFLLGFAIACLLRPAAGFITRHSGMGSRGAAIVSAVVFYALTGGLLWLLCHYLWVGASSFVSYLPELYTGTVQPFLEDLSQLLEGRGFRSGSTITMANQALGEVAASASRWGMELLGGVAKKLPVIALTLVFTILSSVLICMDYRKVVERVLRPIPLKWRQLTLDTRDFLAATLGKTLKAYLILMLLTFGELTLGLWILRAPHFLVAAAVIAVLDLLPVLGSGAVLIPWAAYALLTENRFLGWGMLALWAVVSALRQILEPRVLGGQIGLHPLVTLTAMYAGFRMAGFGGMIAAPIVCLLAGFLSRQGVLPRW